MLNPIRISIDNSDSDSIDVSGKDQTLEEPTSHVELVTKEVVTSLWASRNREILMLIRITFTVHLGVHC